MSDELKVGLATRLREDSNLLDAVSAAVSAEEVVRILGEAGFDLSLDDVSRTNPDGELSDADLEAVSGAAFSPGSPTLYVIVTACYP